MGVKIHRNKNKRKSGNKRGLGLVSYLQAEAHPESRAHSTPGSLGLSGMTKPDGQVVILRGGEGGER